MDPADLHRLKKEYETINHEIASNEEELERYHEELEKIEKIKDRKRKRDLEDKKIEIELDINNTNQYLKFLYNNKKDLEPKLSGSIVKNAMDPTVSTSPLVRLSAHGPHFRGKFQNLISQFTGPGGTRKVRKRKSRKSRKA